MEQPKINVPLSPSMDRIMRGYTEKAIGADVLIREIIHTHPNYGHGVAEKFGEIPLVEQINSKIEPEHRTVEDWFVKVLSILKLDKVSELNGRLVILALATTERNRLAFSDEFLTLEKEIQDEYDPPFTELLKTGNTQKEKEEKEPVPEPAEKANEDTDQAAGSSERNQPVKHTKNTVPYDDLRFLYDNPVDKDLLGRDAFAYSFASHLHDLIYGDADNNEHKDESDKQLGRSLILNIYGPWGSGKSTFMNLIKNHLKELGEEKNQKWMVVDFNAWQHQHLNPPWWPLIQSVRKARQDDTIKFDHPWIRQFIEVVGNRWKHLLITLIFIGLSVVLFSIDFGGETWQEQLSQVGGIITAISALATFIWGINKSLFPSSERSAQDFLRVKKDPYTSLQNKFNRLVNRISKTRRLAIFIDDLDRCEGPYIISLLEGIQTIFRNTPIPVLYLVAADLNWIRKSYQLYYDKYDEAIQRPGHELGQLFIEKIFQLSVPLPKAVPELNSRYVGSILHRDQEGDSEKKAIEDQHKKASENLEKAASVEELLSVIDHVKGSEFEYDIRNQVTKKLVSKKIKKSTQRKLNKYAPLMGINPRAIKRAFNELLIYQLLANQSRLKNEYWEALLLWITLKMRWPAIAAALRKAPDTIEDIKNKNYVIFDDHIRPIFYQNNDEVRKVIMGDAEGINVALDSKMVEAFSLLSYS